MSLSFWFRDFVFMRLVMVLMRNKVFKNRNTTSNVAYVINMMVMGFWHGVTWYYIAYGIFHGIGLGINDAWLRKKKTINKERKKAGLEPIPDNKWTKALGIFITFNTVMLSFLIFSGFLNDLWFTKKISKGIIKMDVKSEVIEIIDELFMEDVSDMMDEDLFDAGVLDSMGTVELIVELESRFDIRVPVSEFGRDDWNTANKIVEGVTELRNA